MKNWLINLILPTLENNYAVEIAEALAERIAPAGEATPEFIAKVLAAFENLPAPE